MTEIKLEFTKAIRSVTKQFTAEKKKVRRQETLNRRQLEKLQMYSEPEMSVKEAAFQVMQQAYLEASTGGTLPANGRQIMYAMRPLIPKLTDKKWKNDSYLESLIPEFLENNPKLTADWDVVYDARGKLLEPHTDRRVDLGTVAVRGYVGKWTDKDYMPTGQDYSIPHMIDTLGPNNRYKFALFVEKEGFNELWESVKLADRYDLAIMSTKGMSTTAARELVEKLSERGVTILVLHDFDKAGFSILHTLRSNTDRYQYKAPPNVIDLGFRLKDVENLPRETVYYKSRKDPRIKLRECGATEEEAHFLVQSRGYGFWQGERVELNAMISGRKLVQWLEAKLKEVGAGKIVPDDDVLKSAYKRAHQIAFVEKVKDDALESYEGGQLVIPDDLRDSVESRIKGTTLSWDEAIYRIAQSRSGEEEQNHENQSHKQIKH
jgi:hypothetical protein